MDNFQKWHPNFPVNLTNCQDEPIRIPGAVQTFGVLIGYEPKTGFVRVVSEKALSIFSQLKEFETKDIRIQEILNFKDLSNPLTKKNSQNTRSLVQVDFVQDKEQKQHYGVTYTSGEFEVIEIETSATVLASEQTDYLRDLPSIMRDIHSSNSLKELADSTAKCIKELTGFDRVMIYRYDDEWNGEVIAEAKEEKLETFLGLHYPSSDIPAQARALYEKNWIRIIPTMEYTPSVLHPKKHQGLDLSNSILRSVSPIHIQYLKNMGVTASMSISLMVDGKLWGLVACHHYSGEHFVPVTLRLSCEAYGQLVSGHIRSLESRQALISQAQGEHALHDVLSKFGNIESVKEAARKTEKEILEMFDCQGVIIRLGDEIVKLGQDPGTLFANAIARALEDNTILEPLISHHASESKALKEIALSPSTAGFMALPLSAKHNYYIICVRPEEVQTVNWAGKPTAKIETNFNDPKQRLIPRGSFELWAETHKGRSKKWSPAVVDLLKRFGLLFVKIVIERKEIVEKSNSELKALNQSKDEFVATVSHELRTPLNAIIGWSELALSGDLDSGQYMEALRVIQRNARSQNQLIGDLLDVSRIISGKLKLSVKNIRVSEIAEAVVLSFSPASDAKGIKIVKSFDEVADSIIGDDGRIQQVLWNLLSNAVKFSPKNSKIWVTVKRVNSHVDVSIKDQGIGIEPEYQEMIFGRFNQVDSSIGRKAGGLGLGLAISRHIVELHGGKISAYSEGLGQGSTFSFQLPIAPLIPQDRTEQIPIDDDFAATTENLKEMSTRLTGQCILIVEDEVDALRFLELLIKANGAKTYTAANGQEALTIIEQHKDELTMVLSDVGMPVMDGHQLMHNIRQSKDEKISSLSTVALTAFGRPQDRINALKSGFDSYITKPVMQEELLTVLESTSKPRKRQ